MTTPIRPQAGARLAGGARRQTPVQSRVPSRPRPAEPGPATSGEKTAPQRPPKETHNVGTLLSEGGASYGLGKVRQAQRVRIPTGDRKYQGVILAEFVTAALIVALAPLARGKAAQDKTPGPSPYGVDDIKQLAGIGAVYFVLALLSSGKWGRISAWFGGLVLVAIGLSETTSGGLPAIFGIFQPSSKSAGAGEITPAQEQQILNQAGQAAQSGANVYPTQQQLFGQAASAAQSGAQFYTFTQPGVATTTETTPGVTVQQI